MTKYSVEEKKKAVELVKKGASLGEAARLTGINLFDS
jgi:transposase-like protein